MKNYFTYTRDLPSDPRFKRDYLTLTPQERISHTLKCPMYDVCKRYNLTKIGRIYCEEFHSAGYGTYAYGYTQVNLARTLTQDGDKYCSFSVILRPENLPDDLKPVCFEEYDPRYIQPAYNDKPPKAKEGYNSLSLRLFCHMLWDVKEQLGEKGETVMLHGLERVVDETAKAIKKTAIDLNKKLDRDFAEQFQPFVLDTSKEPMWGDYDKKGSRDFLQEHYCNVLLKRLDLKSVDK